MEQAIVFIPKYNNRMVIFATVFVFGLIYLVAKLAFQQDAFYLLITALWYITQLYFLQVKRITFSEQIIVEWVILPIQYFSYSAFRDFVIGKGIALGRIYISSRMMNNTDEFNETILSLLRKRIISFDQFDNRLKGFKWLIIALIPTYIALFIVSIASSVVFIDRLHLGIAHILGIFAMIIPLNWLLHWILYHLENLFPWHKKSTLAQQ
jgi:hypothetical protein